jgi:uncharacterized membrane protein YidH (DUF202 family)
MKGVTTKWFVIHVVYQSIGVAVILTGTLTLQQSKFFFWQTSYQDQKHEYYDRENAQTIFVPFK